MVTRGMLIAGLVLSVLAAPRPGAAQDGASPAMTDSMAQAIESGRAAQVRESAPPPQAPESAPPQEVIESPPPSSDPVESTEPPVDAPSPTMPPGRFVAEVIDSTYFIEPAEFFALDLPMKARNGAPAAHILGDVRVVGGRHDIIVRIFRTPDYQNWLKRRGGRQSKPIWSSPRQRAVRLDQELPQGGPLVLLIDNGYSLRTPKRVKVQVQLQYVGSGGAQSVSAQPMRAPQEGDVIPRSNADEEFPPPPPPPPGE